VYSSEAVKGLEPLESARLGPRLRAEIGHRSSNGHYGDQYDHGVTDSTSAAATALQHSRRAELLALIRSRGRVDVVGLPELLAVSAETIRRDLRVLESQGLVRRGYGVAYAVESGAFESALEVRSGINPEEKQRIANAVIPRLGEAQTIFIDEGFQTQLVAQRLPLDRPFTVVTASLPVATLLAPRSNMQVVMLGGRVRGNTLGVADHWPTEMLAQLTIDLAVLGANGVTVERGMTTPDPSVAAVKAAAARASMRRIFIGAHHKFGTASFVRFADVGDFEVLITGEELSATMANRFAVAGANLVRV
jgi:DeoR family fructose operon transcriptional repressor